MSKFYLRYSLKLLVFFFCLSLFESSLANTRSCRNYFGSYYFFDQTLNSVSAYKNDVIRTRGGRLILANPEPAPETRLWGLLLKEDMPSHTLGMFSSPHHFFYYYIPHKLVDVSSHAIQKSLNLLRIKKQSQDPISTLKMLRQKPGDWRFAPIQLIERILIDRPVEVISKELLYTRKRLSLLAKFPLILLLSIKTYEVYDNAAWASYDSTLESSITQAVEKSPQTFIHLINTDYRYDAYRNTLYRSDGSINKQTLLDAAAHSRLYFEYYKVRDQINRTLTLEEERSAFSNNPLFAGIEEFASLDLKDTSSYTVAQDSLGPIPDSKQNSLYKLRHLLLYQYQLLDDLVFNAQSLDSYSAGNQREEIADTLLQDPFILILQSQITKNEIDALQAKYLAQKYLDQVHFLSIFNTLGITYYLDESKKVPLSLEAIRLGSAQELRELKSAK